MTKNRKPLICKNENGNYLADRTKWIADYEGRAAMTTQVPILQGKTTVALIVNIDKNWNDNTVGERAEEWCRKLNAHDDLVAALEHVKANVKCDHLDDWKPVLNALAKANSVQ